MFNMESLQLAPDLSGREALLQALLSFSKEDFSVRLPLHLDYIDEEIAAAFNAAAETNERFAKQARRIEERMKQADREREKVERGKAALEDKAEELLRNSRCKSEFLASMSHELRTPLDSMLILAKLLADNVDDNLSSKQIDYAQTIYSAGTHLQALIDDILDLAKIESGTIALNVEAERFADLGTYFARSFRQVAEDKDLSFDVELAPGLPAAIRTDGKRLQQILRNLLSNAFKFTKQGGVTLRIAPTACDWTPTAVQSGGACQWVEFAVTDTGIGIPEGKRRIIFEAFHRSDGASSREYGGTGLGLSICREFTRMLGGEIRVSSMEGTGSRFTLYLPLPQEPAAAAGKALPLSVALPAPAAKRHDAAPDGTAAPLMPAAGPQPYRGAKGRQSDGGVVLVVEGDAERAALMLGMVRRNGYHGEVAMNLGQLRRLMAESKPDAIILGTSLSDSDGWTVFDLLKHDPETRRLPVSMIHVHGPIHNCLQLGLSDGIGGGATAAPQETLVGLSALAGRAVRKLLVVDTVESQRPDPGAAWRRYGQEVTVLGTGAQVLDALRRGNFDGMVVGGSLLDMTPTDLMRKVMAADMPGDLPVALAGEAYGRAAEIAILMCRHGIEEVLAETTLFLHRAVGSHPAPRQEIPSSRRRVMLELAGRKVLIVDDDVRNIFTITGALEQQGMIVLHAENGAEAIAELRNNPDTDVALVDTAMAGLDSHELIGMIRRIAEFKSLPIIAVTARAAPGHRDKCIEAGASDYIDKPVNVEQMLSLLRAWLIELR